MPDDDEEEEKIQTKNSQNVDKQTMQMKYERNIVREVPEATHSLCVYVTIKPRQPRIKYNTPKCQTFIIIHHSRFAANINFLSFSWMFSALFLLHHFVSGDERFFWCQLFIWSNSSVHFFFHFVLISSLVYSSFREFGCSGTIGVFWHSIGFKNGLCNSMWYTSFSPFSSFDSLPLSLFF